MRLVRWMGEILLTLVVMVVTAGFALGPVWVLQRIPPPPANDGRRYEPPIRVGAVVETPYGAGVVTAKVAYWDGDRWQIRLENGRHVVLYRAQVKVIGHDKEGYKWVGRF